jgi:threonyl-tRNA synthetase
MKKKIDHLYKIRHSLAHLLATAVLYIDPKAKFGIGPVIENGFYYDILFSKKIDENILSVLEEKIKELIQKDIKFEKEKISIDKALRLFKKLNQPFKIELLKDLKKYGTTNYDEIIEIKLKKKKPKKIKEVTIYKSDIFIDLCEGGHVKKASEIPIDGFKLTKLAGAYWRGDEKKPMLTRIYGLAFLSKEELEEYLRKQEEARRRDHRRLGEELKLFTTNENIGAGLILWLPKGGIIRQIIQDFLIETYKNNGYQLVFTPHIARKNLFEISGHLSFYKENMYAPINIEGEEYYLKPMNCPFHLMIYKAWPKSYKDLPIRYAELGTVYRYERSGTLSGLTRVRGFTQDDGHILCREDQLEEEIIKCVNLVKYVLEKFGFKEFFVDLSIWDPTRKKEYLGSNKDWNFAINSLKKAVESVGWNYKVMKGEAAFYGPKIDIKVKDVLDREWQISTIQLDFNLPKRFEIKYIDKDGKEKYPFMIHRALLGSIERFFGLLIEYYAGDFPLWLAPVQIAILPIKDSNLNYSKQIYEKLKKDFRVEIWEPDETLSKRILNAEKEKIPYMVIIGDKEEKENTIAVRKHKEGDLGSMKLEEFIERLKKEV